MGKLARERAKLLAGEINCWHAGCFVATAHQEHPRRWIYEVGLRPRGAALTLTFIYSMQNSFISGRDVVSVKVKILIWGLWEDTTSTQPLLSSSFITSSSSWPSQFPSRHLSTSHLHSSTFLQVFSRFYLFESYRTLSKVPVHFVSETLFVSAAFRLAVALLKSKKHHNISSPAADMSGHASCSSISPAFKHWKAFWAGLQKPISFVWVVTKPGSKLSLKAIEEDQEEWRKWLISCFLRGHSIHAAAVPCSHLKGPYCEYFQIEVIHFDDLPSNSK